MDLFIDRAADRGLGSQLYDQLRDAIVDGRLRTGDRLTPSRALAAELGMSRFTVTEVYARLTAEGYTEGRAGGGTMVASTLSAPTIAVAGTALAPTASATGIRRMERYPSRQARYDMRPGAVDVSLFPTDAWRRCMVKSLRRPPSNYGDPAGTYELRDALARWIARSRGVRTSADDIVVTSGTQHAIDLIARVLLMPGDTVVVEEPGYPPVVDLLRVLGCRVVGVPVDDHGIVVDAFPSDARMVYVTPSHHYPLGGVLSHGRRIALLRWANQHNAAIIEDDYDSQFRYGPRPLEPLQRLDTNGRVIYVGTFSKTMAPSLRVGFAIVPVTLAPAIHALRQAIDWCPPAATQEALAHFIDDGHLDRHLRRVHRVYADRRRRLWHALTNELSVRARPVPSSAGLHLAVLYDEAVDDADLAAATRANDIVVGSLVNTYHFTEPPGGLVVGFGALPAAQMTAAVRALDASLVGIAERRRSRGFAARG